MRFPRPEFFDVWSFSHFVVYATNVGEIENFEISYLKRIVR